MKTINQLQKSTSSLQSMIMMNGSETNLPAVGMFLTMFYYTDRRSERIEKVEGNTFFVTGGYKYFISKRGIQVLNWEGKKDTLKNARITDTDLSYTDPSF